MITERCAICGYSKPTGGVIVTCEQIFKRMKSEGWNMDVLDAYYCSITKSFNMHRDSWCNDYVPRVIIIRKKV